jgi:hypothetical protein
MTITEAIIRQLVNKTILVNGIEESTELIETDGFSIYHDESDTASAATVQVTSTAVVLVITGGANAGTQTMLFSSYLGMDDMVDAIHALNEGWVCTLIGRPDVGSDRLSVFAATSAFGSANKQTLTFDSHKLEVLTESVLARIQTGLGRNLCYSDYTELHDPESEPFALDNPDIDEVTFLGTSTEAVMDITYDGSALLATVEVFADKIRLAANSGLQRSTTDIRYAENQSIAALVTSISAQGDWTATQRVNAPASQLVTQGARNVQDDRMTVYAWEPSNVDYELYRREGTIDIHWPAVWGNWGTQPRRMRIDYSAGYKVLPPDVELAVIEAIKETNDVASRDSTLQSEKIGDYSYTNSSGSSSSGGRAVDVAITNAVKKLAKKYARYTP